MREIVSPISGFRSPFGQLVSPLAFYAVGIFRPEFVSDFYRQKYFTNSQRSTFADAITHTRASTATYVDSTGTLQTAAINEPRVGHHVWNGSAWVNEGLLHESEARTNLLTYSEDLSNAAWLKTGVTIGTPVTRKGISLDLLTSTGTGTFRDLNQSVGSVSNGAYFTLSVFVEAGTSTENAIRIDDGTPTNRHTVPITWTAGVPTLQANSTAGLTPVSASVQDYGDGLYRIHTSVLNGTGGALTLNARYYVVWDDSSAPVTVYAGGFQAEISPTPSSYIPTSGSTVTRAADVLTIPAANLPWPSPVVIGPELTPDPSFDDPTATNDEAVAGYDVVGGELVVVSAPAFHAGVGQSLTQSLVVGKVYQVSYTITEYTSGTIRAQLAGGGSSVNLANSSAVGTYNQIIVASVAHTFLAFQAIVAGTTLKIDNISVREINPLAVSIQMDGRVTYADQDENPAHTFVRWYADGNNRINHILTTAFGTGGLAFQQVSGGVFDQSGGDGSTYSPDILVPYNISARHGSTFVNGAIDGTALTANTTPVALPDLSATDLNLASDYNGTIRTFRIWAQDIGDAGLVEATT